MLYIWKKSPQLLTLRGTFRMNTRAMARDGSFCALFFFSTFPTTHTGLLSLQCNQKRRNSTSSITKVGKVDWVFFAFLGFLCSCQIPRGEANLHGLLRPGTSRLRRRHRSSLQVWSQSRPLHRGNPDRDGRPSLLSIVPPRDHGIYASSDMVLDGRRRSGSVGLRQPVHILCTYEGNL